MTLDEAKTLRKQEIDDRTAELISGGFVYASKTFSLSLAAQSNLEALKLAEIMGQITYPYSYAAIDDTVYSIVDASDLDAFVLTAFGTATAHKTSGTTLKLQIDAAANEAAVDAIIDSR